MIKEDNNIQYKSLSLPLKLSVWGGWVSFVLYIGSFIIGFIGALQ